MACDLNAEMGRKTRNLDAITNGQWYLLKAISLPIMQGGLILPRFYVSTSKSIIKALINMHSFEIQLSPIG
ncbi:hypothetical protein FE609_24930 [Salmonella enterica]|nr:hypothetical protein [Salmonella enterica]EDM6362519.1 hypothetical protein [Salmonella enterica subsp. enterica serovar Typhimurium]EAV9256392.1 hypothetical protein [Salmonella enterica]EAY5284844.1 hypothetical protein [Salmonella enterica]EAY5288604.1 hypothetical protein [Salmonella enterica]